MSSGFGFHGTEGRCYSFWKDVEKCTRETERSGQCQKQVQDYLECLHHKKELTRMTAIAVQKEKNDATFVYEDDADDDDSGH